MNDLPQEPPAQGDPLEARRLAEQALEASRRTQGEEHPETLRAIANLAGVQFAQGELPGARQLAERVLAASRRVLGEEHSGTRRAREGLAIVTAQMEVRTRRTTAFGRKLRRLFGRKP
jgi:hypothetical protein